MQQKIIELLAKRLTVSVEVFPPRNGHSPDIITGKIARLRELKPDFVSITKGACGSMRGGTIPIGYMIADHYKMNPLVHFRSRDHSKREVENLLVDHMYFGIQNMLAVMGDPVKGEPACKPNPRTHNRFASDLVKQITDMNKGRYLPLPGEKESCRDGIESDFCVGVACYPEREHAEEKMVMRAKTAAGAEFAITQMFFEPQLYIDYVKRMRDIGIRIPIIAGIRPVTKPEHVEAAEKVFGAKVPFSLKQAIKGSSPAQARAKCIDYTIGLCREISEAGAPGVHLFILNDVELAEDIVDRIREAVS